MHIPGCVAHAVILILSLTVPCMLAVWSSPAGVCGSTASHVRGCACSCACHSQRHGLLSSAITCRWCSSCTGGISRSHRTTRTAATEAAVPGHEVVMKMCGAVLQCLASGCGRPFQAYSLLMCVACCSLSLASSCGSAGPMVISPWPTSCTAVCETGSDVVCLVILATAEA